MEFLTLRFVVLIGISLAVFPSRAFPQGGLDQASPIGPFLNDALPPATPRNGTGAYALTNAFPNLTFIDPIQMIPVPESNRFAVLEKTGRLVVFNNEPGTLSGTVLFDIRANVESSWDSGMLGFAFHPDFGKSGSPNRDFLFLYYRFTPNRVETDRAYCRLSRFTWNAGASTIDPASESVLINQYDRHNWHNGGGLLFGADGFLYLSIGDEGGAGDSYDAGQKRNAGLLAGILRIDVDRDPIRSHPIRRQPISPATPPPGWPDSFSQGYYIPNDNPWQSPDGSQLEEFYAIGLRSPHRMTRDPMTGRIWVGDVGQGSYEEISLVEKGANLQWPYFEGPEPGPKSKPSPLTGFDQPPVYSYDRTQGGCVIGGYVYRGSGLPDLYGKYVFGDHNTGAIRALTYDPPNSPIIEELATMPLHGTGPKIGLSGFAVDGNGEIYLLSLAGTNLDGGIIYKLEQSGPAIPEPPALLSQTGAFQDLASLTPSPGIIPYDVIQPLWSDGAEKMRWIAIPNDGSPDSANEQIAFSETEEWEFPEGTVLIKHFAIGSRRLETRFLVHGDDGLYYGLTYKWRPDNSDADLLPGPPVDETIDLGGGQSINWHFPGRAECANCHTQASKSVLGVKTRHLNGDFFYAVTGRTANQISTLNQLGFFNPAPFEADIPSFPAAANLADTSATLEQRARSYLDINCSQCHRPGGPTEQHFDLRLSTPLANQGIIDIAPENDLGISGARIVKPASAAESVLYHRVNTVGGPSAMPPIAKGLIDTVAVQLLAAWINSLDPSSSTPSSSQSGLRYEYYEGDFDQVPDFSILNPVKSGVVSGLDLSPRLSEDTYAFRFTGALSLEIPGVYTLYLTSDDGSLLSIDGGLVIDNDGLHGQETRSAAVNLSAGVHSLEVGFFESLGDAILLLEIEGPGLPRQPIPEAIFFQSAGGGGESGNNGGGGGGGEGSATPPPPGNSGNSSNGHSKSFPVQFRPDNWIGNSFAKQRGNNLYNKSGRAQNATLRFSGQVTRSLYFTVQNDRLTPDTLRVKASRQDRDFKIDYFQLTGGSRRITPVIAGSGLRVTNLPPGAYLSFKAEIKPSRKRLGRRKTRRIWITSSSISGAPQPDRVMAKLIRKN